LEDLVRVPLDELESKLKFLDPKVILSEMIQSQQSFFYDA